MRPAMRCIVVVGVHFIAEYLPCDSAAYERIVIVQEQSVRRQEDNPVLIMSAASKRNNGIEREIIDVND